MKALVTGGAGFIGSRLIAKVRSQGGEAVGLDVRPSAYCMEGDVRKVEDVVAAMGKCDVVYHLAGPVVETVRKNLYESLDLQMAGTLAVMEAARRQKRPPKVIVASSFYVYAGQSADTVVNEQTTLDLRETDAFGASKLMTERIARAFGETYGVKWVALRFGSVYGYGDCSNVVKTFLEAGLRRETVEIWGRGLRKNQYTYVDDVVEGCYRAAELENVIVNLVAPEVVTTASLADLLRSLYGFDNVVFNEDKAEGGSMAWMASHKAQELLGWMPQSLYDGVHKMMEDLQDAAPPGVVVPLGK